MTLSRRSFFAALAGLPVLGRVLSRAPMPNDGPALDYGTVPFSSPVVFQAFAVSPTEWAGPYTQHNG